MRRKFVGLFRMKLRTKVTALHQQQAATLVKRRNTPQEEVKRREGEKGSTHGEEGLRLCCKGKSL